MNRIETILRAWQRTTNHKTDIQDEDWKTLIDMCNKHELDAMKEGMHRAKELARQWTDNYVIEDNAPKQIDDTILSAAESLTEKDL